MFNVQGSKFEFCDLFFLICYLLARRLHSYRERCLPDARWARALAGGDLSAEAKEGPVTNGLASPNA